MKKFKYLSILFVLFLSSCYTSNNDFNDAKIHLEQQGYIDIEMDGLAPVCCSSNSKSGYMFRTGFTAKTKDNKLVSGCICSNLFGGYDIKFK